MDLPKWVPIFLVGGPVLFMYFFFSFPVSRMGGPVPEWGTRYPKMWAWFGEVLFLVEFVPLTGNMVPFRETGSPIQETGSPNSGNIRNFNFTVP